MSRFIALRYRDFRLLWIGSFISWTGSEMSTIALTWMLYQMTGSALALGTLGLMRAIPMIVFSLIGGGIADRFDRKGIILSAQIILSLLSSILLVAALSGALRPWMIYLTVFIEYTVSAFGRPARQSLLPHLVEKQHFGHAVQLSSTMWQSTVLLGPALGGLLMSFVGPLPILFIDLLSFIPFIICIVMMRTPPPPVQVHDQSGIQSLISGMRFVLGKRLIFGTMILDFFVSFFAMAKSLFPLYADQILHVGATGLGFLHSATAAGAILAGIVVNPAWYEHRQGKVLIWSVGCVGVATMLFAYTSTLWVSCATLALLGAADFVSMNIRMLVRQINTPDHLMGRVSGIHVIFSGGGPTLGEMEAGLLATLLGVQHSVFAGGLLAVLSALVIARLVPEIGRYRLGKA
ncbi:MAG: MFS transporter [bacterium]